MLRLMMNKLPTLVFALTVLGLAGLSACADATDKQAEPSAELKKSAAALENTEQLATILALEADVEFGAYLAGECLTCHTPTGANGSIPVIHGKDKQYLANALLEYRQKQRSNEVMQGVSAALTNEEIAALAAYISEQ